MSKLDTLHRKQLYIIRNYCDLIGCKNCPKKSDTDCESIRLQTEIMKLEFET
jgi:hypothetical protein